MCWDNYELMDVCIKWIKKWPVDNLHLLLCEIDNNFITGYKILLYVKVNNLYRAGVSCRVLSMEDKFCRRLFSLWTQGGKRCFCLSSDKLYTWPIHSVGGNNNEELAFSPENLGTIWRSYCELFDNMMTWMFLVQMNACFVAVVVRLV